MYANSSLRLAFVAFFVSALSGWLPRRAASASGIRFRSWYLSSASLCLFIWKFYVVLSLNPLRRE